MIGGEGPAVAVLGAVGLASTEPPIVIGGETHYAQGRTEDRAASTEPPIVIGGESRAWRDRSESARASTEPPIVIGGEGWTDVDPERVFRSFNGAADRDRRRVMVWRQNTGVAR